MTRMSEIDARQPPASTRNHARSLNGSRLARSLHAHCQPVVPLLAMTMIWMLEGCVIPPSLEVDQQDAGVNSPPAILSITSDQQALPEPGPVLFDRGPSAGSLSLSLIDTDATDTLYVRIFVDYNLPDRLPARATCTATPNMTHIRTATCDLSALCATADIGVQRNMSIVVFDRQPLESGEPPFQAMPVGGLSTSRFYFLKCQPPPT